MLVSRIRRKIEPDPQDATMIKTVRSGGYMFTPTVEAAMAPLDERHHEAVRLSQSEGHQRQIAALVVASIVAIHLILTATFLIHRPDQLDPSVDRGTASLPRRPRCSAHAAPTERPRLLADIARAFPQARHRKPAPGAAAASGTTRSEPRTARPASPPRQPATNLSARATNDDPHKVGIALPDGAMISAKLLPNQRPRPFWSGPWMMTVLFAVDQRQPAQPVGGARPDRAAVVLRQGRGEFQPERHRRRRCPNAGPEEIRSVAKALNRMRERITALIDDRTKMLAAISHDLRTPITRMRLRSEFIEDEAHRGRMLGDLDQMRSMLESVLSFLRNDRKLESMTLADIATTLQLVTDQFADMGHKVVYEGPEHAMATVRPDDLHAASPTSWRTRSGSAPRPRSA